MVPSLYFCDGASVCGSEHGSAVLYKDLPGISDAQIAFWTSLIMAGHGRQVSVEPFFLGFARQKKFWVVGSQLLSGVLFGVALSLHQLPLFLGRCCCLCGRCLQRGDARHRGRQVYMSELSPASQAKPSAGRGRSTTLRNWSPRAVWCGLRGGFTRVCSTSGTRIVRRLYPFIGRSFAAAPVRHNSSLWAFTPSPALPSERFG